ncbi:MAG: hypothetical protein ACYS9C_17475, partial [Planctomycetota bacterium]
MDDYRQIILSAKPGEIIPIVKEIDMEETVDFFATKTQRHKEKLDRITGFFNHGEHPSEITL